jgi:small subunit ribosomal protein S4
LGWAPTRAAARQIVSHNHVTVNNKKLNVASYQVQVGDVLSLKAKAAKIPAVADLLKSDHSLPGWLETKGTVGSVTRLPVREDVTEMLQEQLIVEYYSK